MWVATKKSIRLRILKHNFGQWFKRNTNATKKSIRLRILKPKKNHMSRLFIVATKKSIRLRILKLVNPFAERYCLFATKKSIRLRILKHETWTPTHRAIAGYKKIDPFADTETQLRDAPAIYRVKLQKNRSVCGY